MENRTTPIAAKTYITEPQVVGRHTIRLQSQALSIRFPFGGFVWHRPTAVLVGQHGQTETIPVVDVTRYVVWLFAALSVLLPIAIRLLLSKSNHSGSNKK